VLAVELVVGAAGAEAAALDVDGEPLRVDLRPIPSR
jgi:hypothetical protein